MKKVEVEDNRSDIQKDMDALSEVRDLLLNDFKSACDSDEKSVVAHSLTHVINARQNSELLQLRIWGILDEHERNHGDDDGEHCPDCGELMTEHDQEPKKNNDNN
jgi:hypothetical protein